MDRKTIILRRKMHTWREELKLSSFWTIHQGVQWKKSKEREREGEGEREEQQENKINFTN